MTLAAGWMLGVTVVLFAGCAPGPATDLERQPAGIAPIEVARPVAGDVRFIRPEDLALDTLGLVPHRSEFADMFHDTGERQQRAWRYTQLTHAHNWDAHDIIISDTNFSWHGTGTDQIVADGATMTLLTRTMPYSIPSGVLVSSHYGNEVTASFARPDGEFVFRKEGPTTYFDRDASVASEDRPPRRLANRRVYGYSLWPYVFSLMDLEPGATFVLPGYELSNDSEYFARVVVHGTTTVTDERQRDIPALVVRLYSQPTLQAALALDPTRAGPVSEYYVSGEPPYYLGYRRGQIADGGALVVSRESVFLDFETLTVSPRRRLESLLEIRRGLLDGAEQVHWWRNDQ